jgi:hypothetical protein
MEIKQTYKYKDADGKLIAKEISLEFREIDRCRRNDQKLFYTAMRLINGGSKDDAGFEFSPVEGMGELFINALIEKGPDFNETEFTLLKNDVVALYQLNSEIFVKLIVPFITTNLLA